ncbi:MAG: DUF2244 domain-containing protein [Burkholderiales bacterium]|nr:DUF2244 domain-containing protein [Burkholderiales bacterium]
MAGPPVSDARAAGCVAGARPDTVPAEFLLRRNCSIAPWPLLAVFASLAAVSFAFGAAFASFGPWLILPFVGLEVLALGAAFAVCSARAGDHERIRVGVDALTVEDVAGRRRETRRFDPQWARLEVERGPQRIKVFLTQSGRRAEVGRHLGFERRTAFADDLRAALAAARAAAGPA